MDLPEEAVHDGENKDGELNGKFTSRNEVEYKLMYFFFNKRMTQNLKGRKVYSC
jgi:hypothetical protein